MMDEKDNVPIMKKVMYLDQFVKVFIISIPSASYSLIEKNYYLEDFSYSGVGLHYYLNGQTNLV